MNSWRKELVRIAKEKKLKGFDCLGVHNEGKALHIIVVYNKMRIGWWPLSKRQSMYVTFPGQKDVVLRNVGTVDEFFECLESL